ncbi:MAG TPA: PEP-CTERM sorting domain-containing protein [Fimbriimonadaceae bacterium]|nr:PEP-CTERM sorting domain-containing protein [Fimbriimonadaceae bacterium]
MKKFLIPALVGLGAIFSITSASAALTFEFNTVVTGGVPNGPTPWATLTLEDVAANTVSFSMTNTTNNSTPDGSFIRELELNIDPFVTNLGMQYSAPEITGFIFSQDGVNDAGAMFDYSVDFVTANNPNRFTPGKTVTWTVTGDGLTASNFFGQFSAGNNSYESMVHINGIPPDNISAKITNTNPVPEPATFAALGLGLAALLKRRRK